MIQSAAHAARTAVAPSHMRSHATSCDHMHTAKDCRHRQHCPPSSHDPKAGVLYVQWMCVAMSNACVSSLRRYAAIAAVAATAVCVCVCVRRCTVCSSSCCCCCMCMYVCSSVAKWPHGGAPFRVAPLVTLCYCCIVSVLYSTTSQ